MAYDPLNPPGLLAQRSDSGGARIWSYKSPDTFAEVEDTGYFSNGATLGMQLGDAVLLIQDIGDSDFATWTYVSAIDADTGATTVTNLSDSAIALAAITARVAALETSQTAQDTLITRSVITIGVTGTGANRQLQVTDNGGNVVSVPLPAQSTGGDTPDENTFVNGAAFNSANNVLTISLNDGTTVTADLSPLDLSGSVIRDRLEVLEGDEKLNATLAIRDGTIVPVSLKTTAPADRQAFRDRIRAAGTEGANYSGVHNFTQADVRVKDPTIDDNAANKRYVDQAVEGSTGGGSGSGVEVKLGVVSSAGAITDATTLANFVSSAADGTWNGGDVRATFRSSTNTAFPVVAIKSGSFGVRRLSIGGGAVDYDYIRIDDWQVWQASASRTVSTTSDVTAIAKVENLEEYARRVVSKVAPKIIEGYKPQIGDLDQHMNAGAQLSLGTDASIISNLQNNEQMSVSWANIDPLKPQWDGARFRLELETSGSIGAFNSSFATIEDGGTLTRNTGNETITGAFLRIYPRNDDSARHSDSISIPLERNFNLLDTAATHPALDIQDKLQKLIERVVDLENAMMSGMGTSTFIGDSDTPASYTGHALDFLQVNSSGNGIQFTSVDGDFVADLLNPEDGALNPSVIDDLAQYIFNRIQAGDGIDKSAFNATSGTFTISAEGTAGGGAGTGNDIIIEEDVAYATARVIQDTGLDLDGDDYEDADILFFEANVGVTGAGIPANTFSRYKGWTTVKEWKRLQSLNYTTATTGGLSSSNSLTLARGATTSNVIQVTPANDGSILMYATSSFRDPMPLRVVLVSGGANAGSDYRTEYDRSTPPGFTLTNVNGDYERLPADSEGRLLRVVGNAVYRINSRLGATNELQEDMQQFISADGIPTKTTNSPRGQPATSYLLLRSGLTAVKVPVAGHTNLWDVEISAPLTSTVVTFQMLLEERIRGGLSRSEVVTIAEMIVEQALRNYSTTAQMTEAINTKAAETLRDANQYTDQQIRDHTHGAGLSEQATYTQTAPFTVGTGVRALPGTPDVLNTGNEYDGNVLVAGSADGLIRNIWFPIIPDRLPELAIGTQHNRTAGNSNSGFPIDNTFLRIGRSAIGEQGADRGDYTPRIVSYDRSTTVIGFYIYEKTVS